MRHIILFSMIVIIVFSTIVFADSGEVISDSSGYQINNEIKCNDVGCYGGGCYVYYNKIGKILCKKLAKDLAKAVAEECRNVLPKIKDALCEKNSDVGTISSSGDIYRKFIHITLQKQDVLKAARNHDVYAYTGPCCKKVFDDIHAAAELIMSTATNSPDKSKIQRIIPHEMTHVFQSSYAPLGTGTDYGLFAEGIADYGGFASVGKQNELYCQAGHNDDGKIYVISRSRRYLSSLPVDEQCLGAFLKWMQEKYPKASICELHKFLKNDYKSLIKPDESYDNPLNIWLAEKIGKSDSLIISNLWEEFVNDGTYLKSYS